MLFWKKRCACARSSPKKNRSNNGSAIRTARPASPGATSGIWDTSRGRCLLKCLTRCVRRVGRESCGPGKKRSVFCSMRFLKMPLETVLSGMRPSGKLHLGNYFGALVNWLQLQSKYRCFYMIADWHALTSEYADTSRVEESVWDMVLDWLA